MSMVWCLLSVVFGLALLLGGIGLRLKVDIPHIGTISGSVGAVLLAVGILAGIFGFCPI